MKQINLGWKDIALLIAVVVIAVMAFKPTGSNSHGISPEKPLVRIDDYKIYEGDLIRALKRQQGTNALIGMVNEGLIAKLAGKKNIMVTREEVDQLINDERFWALMRGENFDDSIVKAGITDEELRRQVTQMAMKLKLVVSEDDVRKAVAAAAAKMIPPVYQPQAFELRQLMFATSTEAANAKKLLDEGEANSLNTVGQMSLSPNDTKRTFLYCPPLTPANEMINEALKSAAAGSTTKILPMKAGAKKDSPIIYVLFLVEKILPPIMPTFENRNLVTAKILVNSDKKYQSRIDSLEAQAVNDIDWQFYTPEFPLAQKHFEDVKVRNPQIPGMNDEEEDTAAPATPKPDNN
jgi:hypothetical protein